MKIERIDRINRIKITASEGMMLTDGTDYAEVAFLREGDDGSAYYEITRAEYDAIIAEQEKAVQPA